MERRAFYEKMWDSPGFQKLTSTYTDPADRSTPNAELVRLDGGEDPHRRRRERLPGLLSRAAELPGQLGGVLRKGPGDITAQLVRLAEVAVAGQDGSRRGRVVGAGGGGHPALAALWTTALYLSTGASFSM